jgi:hypothetical protein
MLFGLKPNDPVTLIGAATPLCWSGGFLMA